ncbi:MAG TPA: glycoside hydrolase family 38 C-terminal domain-containing protein, partial [Puia sp.]|nr:glycoside hydrolase family 38 C-terminal domain-containing protein [Puia sp.]
RTLLLSQHHDCWIVPYNGKAGDTWADKVVKWTGNTNRYSDSVIGVAAGAVGGPCVKVFNTTGVRRTEWVRAGEILFKADVPPMGYRTYQLKNDRKAAGSAKVKQTAGGSWQVETDLYRIVLDPSKGGVITSWVAKRLGAKEFVEEGKSFNELRGNFYNAGGFRSSTETPAEIRVLEEGPAEVRLSIKGMIAGNPFTQVLTVQEGQPRVDMHLVIDWKGNPAIGEYSDAPKDNEVRKAYYDDRYKLLALFPLRLAAQRVFKNAPFDVAESRLDNTFYNRWDSIKNNVLLNWVDVEDGDGKYGMALFCDHTTSYGHGVDFPLALTVQYSGNGIFYRDYKIDGPTEMNYAWLPHAGSWDQAGIWAEGTKWNEPLIVRTGGVVEEERSLLQPERAGMEISSVTLEGNYLLARLFNAEATGPGQKLYLGFAAETAAEVGLDGRVIKEVAIRKERSGRRFVELSIPRFGIRTLRFK